MYPALLLSANMPKNLPKNREQGKEKGGSISTSWGAPWSRMQFRRMYIEEFLCLPNMVRDRNWRSLRGFIKRSDKPEGYAGFGRRRRQHVHNAVCRYPSGTERESNSYYFIVRRMRQSWSFQGSEPGLKDSGGILSVFNSWEDELLLNWIRNSFGMI